MRSKKRVLEETSKLMSGRSWFAVAQVLGLTALEIALDFREMYRIKNCPQLDMED